MKPLKHHTLKEYIHQLSAKTPVPGGGSAAALTGALGVALISMAANYSCGKNSLETIEKNIKEILGKSEKIKNCLLKLVDLDAQAYRDVVKARKASPVIKSKALNKARAVSLEVAEQCYQAIKLTPYLVQRGNLNLIADVQIAIELLLAAYHSAMVNVEFNQ